jgi:hypothetical protein
MASFRYRFRPHALAALLVLVVPACSDDGQRPATPPAPTSNTFYPLKVGTAWTYDSHRVVRFLSQDGGDVRPPIDQTATVMREIVISEDIDARSWAVEEERFVQAGAADTVLSWRRYREDAGGLYRADLPTTLPPGSGAGLDSVTAARRLSYPLSSGVSWALHEGDPAETGTVLRMDTLITAAGPEIAFLVAYDLAGDGPEDWRHFRYSPRGLLGSTVFREVVAVDGGSGETIVIQSTETTLLRDEPQPALPAGVTPKITRRGRWTEARPAPVRR